MGAMEDLFGDWNMGMAVTKMVVLVWAKWGMLRLMFN